MRQRIIGLTGGIATGKSTVASYLEELRIPVLDADYLARLAVLPESPTLKKIVGHFGSEILTETGELNRRELGKVVFASPSQKAWLEAQIHPYVREQLLLGLQSYADRSIVCLMIPLLFEARMTDLVTEIWVVTCPPDIQKQRILRRDHLSLTEVEDRLKSQWPLEAKCQQADVILDNSGSLADLKSQVMSLVQRGEDS
jgi:dephospho-CoA kinase